MLVESFEWASADGVWFGTWALLLNSPEDEELDGNTLDVPLVGRFFNRYELVEAALEPAGEELRRRPIFDITTWMLEFSRERQVLFQVKRPTNLHRSATQQNPSVTRRLACENKIFYSWSIKPTSTK
jgi:hypothetical protein